MASYPICTRVPVETRDLVDQAWKAAGFDTRGDWLAHVIDRALAAAGLLPAEDIARRREARDARPDRGPRSPYAGYAVEQQAAADVDEVLRLIPDEELQRP